MVVILHSASDMVASKLLTLISSIPSLDSNVTRTVPQCGSSLSLPLKLGTLPSGHYPSVIAAADNGTFIIRLPRHLGPYWYETQYVLACDQNQAFIWSTESREFIIRHHLSEFKAFVTGTTPYRPYITSGVIEDTEDGISHTRGSRVKINSDKSWLESLSQRSLLFSRRPGLFPPGQGVVGTTKLKLLLDNTLKLILPIEYHPILPSMGPHDGPEEWYGDRVIGSIDFVYFPHASKDGTRFLVQGRMRAPIVVDISQIV
ncbi:uncharacterized protein EI90DRAFT_1022305 [Cantharellus anzutake]|uniref:uncharacterized protein n=1 Tax=Cantharellus anzutake TaxID=1750568 RepID=UPI0019090196|nr:uncharacterized protein EI90DRAFT_1022305 [Cantharellus anzutake]KAF8331436.1 hypothetical protein EI90DRAFT_1022305 [Cantharellus anzutake]